MVRLVDENGNVLASVAIATVDGEWSATTLELGPVSAAQAGHNLHIEVVNSGGSSGQILVDNVTLTVTEPGGSANDGHIIVAGLDGNDYIVGALGDDTIYGDAGDDWIEGAQGNDHLYGGDGNDHITDYENDDFISGGAGDDYVSAGPGVLDTIHGNEGNDELHGGDGIDEVFGDDGDDLLYGEGDTDLMFGGDGNDYMDGGDSVDEMFGGNGNDWMRGGVGDDNINGGSGNDLMEGGLGPSANDGDRLNGDTAPGALPVIEFNGDGTEGDMDIVSYENAQIAIFANLQDANANGTSSNLLDTYALVEGLVGSAQNDQLTGADDNGTAGNGTNNYLIGGGGNDTLIGLGGDDFIFGDSVVVDNDLYWVGDARHDAAVVETGRIDNWRGTGETRVVFSDGSLGHVLGDHGTDGAADKVVFSGNRNDYIITALSATVFNVIDTRGIDSTVTGGDIVMDVELFQFADMTLGSDQLINVPPEGQVTISGWAAAGQPGGSSYLLTANIGTVTDGNGINPGTAAFKWEYSTDGGITWNLVAGAVGQTYTPGNLPAGSLIQVTYSYTDGGGTTESLTSAPTDAVGQYWSGNNNNNGHTGTDYQDVLLGNGGNDNLRGGAGNDLVDGGAGDDSIRANVGDGNDVYIGGDGTDTLYLNQTLADANVNLDGVAYTVNGQTLAASTATSADIGTDSLDGIENVTGSQGNNILIGDSGANVLSGLQGNDILIGGAGADTLIGGGGNDTASYVTASDMVGVTADLTTGLGSGGDAQGDTYAGIENLTGSNYNDVLIGKNGVNVLDGGAGDDMLYGGTGGDMLIGGVGDDTLNGGAGNDTFVFACRLRS